ncbi:MAG: hypothetical protein O7F69_08585 [Alphaproteobacteria bacterium]|nr:hypothetical protein [Alphaproteobacteria bacterium]
MSKQREATTVTVVSLGLSLSLAGLLLMMAVSADPGQPLPLDPQAVEAKAPAATRQEPDLGAVYLPPPPAIAPPANPSEPPTPADPPTATPAPPVIVAAVQRAVVPADPPPASEPLPEPQTAFRPPPAPVEITREEVREGRALLRLLERGEGPDIEIAWPAAAANRSDLYRLFSNCFGMRTVVMTADGEMYDATGGQLTAERFDADRYSGFVRQPAGGLSAAERAQVNAIRDGYGLAGGQVLRLFPRRVDAILLGALHRIAGGVFDKSVRIRARYRAVDNGIQIADIQVDGRAVNDIILLPYTAQRACRAEQVR